MQDLILTTILYNVNRRGFRFHALKAQLLADQIRLVGCFVDEKGVTPSPNKGLFEALKKRDHKNIKAVQKTLGSLQWFSIFMPNFSYTLRHLTRLLKQGNRNASKANLTEECKQAIEEVERYVEEVPVLAHPSDGNKRETLLVYGDEASACSIFQINKDNKHELLQFWARK